MAAGDLTTLAYVQAYIGNPLFGNSPSLPAIITAASVFVANFCSRNFYITAYNDTFNGSGNCRLMLRSNPVVSVASLTINGQNVPAAPSVIQCGYTFDKYGLWLRGWVFPKTIQGIAVSYSAGYAASADAMPADLQECIAIMCNIRLKRVGQEDKSSVGMENQTTTFVASELTPLVRQILAQYKQPLLASP